MRSTRSRCSHLSAGEWPYGSGRISPSYGELLLYAHTPACAVKPIAGMIEPYSGVVYDKIIAGLIQAYGERNTSKLYEISGFEVL